MKKTFTLLFLFVLISAFTFAQVHIGGKFTPKKTTVKPDSAYFGDIGIRGSWVAPDLDNDGKPEIIVTDYTKGGRVHAFQAAGNDTLEWIWSSPRYDTLPGLPFGNGAPSTPRVIRSGDLDGDGKGEIIFPRGGTGAGFFIFEWDGVNGSHKFGSIHSALIPHTVTYGSNFGSKSGTAIESGLQLNMEFFEIADVDGDGKQEILAPKNVANNLHDDYLIISANGEWDFENQGFAVFEVEGSSQLLANTAYFGAGSPWAIHPADLDGDGKKELVCHNFNFGNYWVMKVTGDNTYVLPDTAAPANGKQYYRMTPTYDHYAIFGGIVADLDKDNNQEVYIPYYGAGGPDDGSLFVIDYNPGDDVQKADSTHAVRIAAAVSQTSSGAALASFTGTVADLDRNGKQEILIGSAYPSNVVAIEYNGTGSLRDPANYTRKVLYQGESNTFLTVNYRDSLGIKDTVRVVGEGFVSKMSKAMDIDGDGRVEIILPYQSLADSTTYSWQQYDLNISDFVTDSSKKINVAKKWAFRSLESDGVGSVGNRDYTVITPDDYQLNQNYPNPFNPSTTISFVLPLNKKISAKIYDMLGKEVRTLINSEDYAKGGHSIVWNGKDNYGKSVASGSYIFRMTAGNVEKTLKMMMLK